MSLPLAGITVVELGHSVAAPYAGEILADLGAEVVKVERHGHGDDARGWGPPFVGETSATFLSLNRNKKSVCVDLRNEDERGKLKNYIQDSADVLIQNLRPGLAEQLGLDEASLRARKPELIYTTIGAFGAVGPLSKRPGYDPLMQAFGGLMSVTGEPEQRPVRVGTSIIDMAAGMWAVIGILSALFQRSTSGTGAKIDTSLYEVALSWMCYHAANYEVSGDLPKRQGSGTVMIVPYRGYEASNGFIVIGAGNNNLFNRLAIALDRPNWAEDPRFKTNADRVRNRVELDAEIEALVGKKTLAEMQALLDDHDIPNAPMQTIDQVLSHPQTQELKMSQKSPGGQLDLFGPPISIDGERPPFRRDPPALGAHTDEILNQRKSN